MIRAVSVDAGTREGEGGSATTVVLNSGPFTDEQRARLARRVGTSHTAFVAREDDEILDVRFFTRERELTGCGHGTIAVHAALGRPGSRRQTTGGRTFVVDTASAGAEFEVAFDQGVVTLTEVRAELWRAVSDALGLGARDFDAAAPPAIASPGAPRLLLAVSPSGLGRLAPDLRRLEALTREAGLLGCFAYAAFDAERHYGARMFAPAIGVGEDVSNANSTGCLAALVTAMTGQPASITVDQGDHAGSPSRIVARGLPTSRGIVARLSGRAVVRGSEPIVLL